MNECKMPVKALPLTLGTLRAFAVLIVSACNIIFPGYGAVVVGGVLALLYNRFTK